MSQHFPAPQSSRLKTFIAALVATAGLGLGTLTGSALLNRPQVLPDPVGISPTAQAIAPIDGPDEGAACMLSGAPSSALHRSCSREL